MAEALFALWEAGGYMKRLVCLIFGHKFSIVRTVRLRGFTVYALSPCQRCGKDVLR